jgi:hypothetical protein
MLPKLKVHLDRKNCKYVVLRTTKDVVYTIINHQDTFAYVDIDTKEEEYKIHNQIMILPN